MTGYNDKKSGRMSFAFRCPACEFETTLPEVFLAQRVQCPDCGGVFVLSEDGVAIPVAARPQGELLTGDLTRTCPFCQERVHPSARKCRHCGEILDRGLARAKKIEEHREFERRQRLFAPPESRRALASLSLSILGVLVAGALPGLGTSLGVLAVVLGGMALHEFAKKPEVRGKGMALAGMILGALAIVGGILTYLAARGSSLL